MTSKRRSQPLVVNDWKKEEPKIWPFIARMEIIGYKEDNYKETIDEAIST